MEFAEAVKFGDHPVEFVIGFRGNEIAKSGELELDARCEFGNEFVSGVAVVFGKDFKQVGFANASALEFGSVAIFAEPRFAAVDFGYLSEDIKERGLFHALEGVKERERCDGALERQEFGELLNFLLKVLFGTGHYGIPMEAAAVYASAEPGWQWQVRRRRCWTLIGMEWR